MVDRRSLRKQNQRLNQSEPILPEPQKGSIGDRNRDTGKYATNLGNNGTYQVNKIFDASVGSETQVQLNEGTGTADYRSADEEQTIEAILEARAVGLGVPDPDGLEDEGDNNPDNPFFGNCGVCNSKSVTRLDCPSGEGRITFADGQIKTFPTPAEIEYGGKVNFSYTNGQTGSLYVNSCADVEVSDDSEDFTTPYNPEVYGKLIYQQKATSWGAVSGLKEFQIYQNECAVTVVGVNIDGQRTMITTTTCDEIEETYGVKEPTTCVTAGTSNACGIDPDSLTYDCVVRVYRLCQKYFVRWVNASDGEPQLIESCEQVGYAVTSEIDDTGYKPGARNTGTGFLKYDSGIPRTFIVNAGGESFASGAEYGYFQIYQSVDNPCEYDIVGVKITGDKATFSGATTSKEYKTIYTGGCGFEVVLGDYIAEQILTIYNAEGDVLLETPDFVPSSVEGCEYDTESGDFSGSCRNTAVNSRVPVFEKTVSADTVGGVGVESVECVL